MRILESDASPLTINAFDFDGGTRRVHQPISIAVEFDPEDGCYIGTGDFHLMVTAETREELETAVLDAIAYLWREYVVAEPGAFSSDALALRQPLEAAFGAANAAG